MDVAAAPKRTRLPPLVVVAIAVALLASLWSLAGLEGCFGCGEKGKLVGRLPLPIAGACFYGALLALLLTGRLGRLASVAILGAAGAHAVLLALLLKEHIVCLPCYVAGGAALAAAATLALLDPRLRRTTLIVVPAAIALTLVGLKAARWEASGYRLRVARSHAIEAVEALGAPPAGKVHLFHWKRPGCGACALYETKVLPWIEERRGGALLVSSKTTLEEGVPTPVVVVFGQRCVFFPMIPLPSELELAIAVALGEREFDPAEFTRGYLLEVEFSGS